ncbi:MAG TPA: sulfatase-like hydrolase/transferase, partial [Tepidisphaeraceae bacterium]
MKQNRRPNVVLCVCDQLRAFEAGCYGNAVIRTPNIDRLAAGGVRFDVACSNNPICCPARAILLTGQHSRTCTGMR